MTLWWQQLLLVMSGGAIGAAGRHLLGGWMTRHAGAGMPWGTLSVNLIGSFLAGFLLVWLENRGPDALLWRAFLMVGALGAFTTYSALMLEMLLLERTGGLRHAGGYLALSLLGGLALVWAGTVLAGALRQA
jgi:CrcB protein